MSRLKAQIAAATLIVCALPCACGPIRPAPAPPQTEEGAGKPEAAWDIPEPVPLPERWDVTDRVEIKTSMGTMVVGLYGDAAPATVANFLAYVDKGFYSQKVFHRVIPGFMVQGGGYDADLARQETDPPVKLEIIPGLRHEPGTVSMARTSDPNSATAQFFVCVAITPQLNGAYAVFGKLEEGFDVAANISAVKTHRVETDRGAMDDVPVTPVFIEYIKRLD